MARAKKKAGGKKAVAQPAAAPELALKFRKGRVPTARQLAARVSRKGIVFKAQEKKLKDAIAGLQETGQVNVANLIDLIIERAKEKRKLTLERLYAEAVANPSIAFGRDTRRYAGRLRACISTIIKWMEHKAEQSAIRRKTYGVPNATRAEIAAMNAHLESIAEQLR